MSLISFVGIFLIVAAVVFMIWWVATGRPHQVPLLSAVWPAIFAGIFFVLADRVTELTIEGVGTIKAAAQQAVADAKEVAEMKRRIEAQSATVDLVAKEATEAKRLSEDLSQKNHHAEQRLSELDQTLNKASGTLSELQRITEFTSTVSLAQNDDRKAFDRLKSWADDKSNPFSHRAEQAWTTILDQHSGPMYMTNFTFPWKEGFDPSKFTLQDLRTAYDSLCVGSL